MKTIPLDEARRGKANLVCQGIQEFMNTEFPENEFIFSPIIQKQSLTLMYAKRGVGKTYFALSVALALASGGEFLKWNANKPVKVLYIDGEMQAKTMQQRLKGLIEQSVKVIDLSLIQFEIITPDTNRDRGMPDISTQEGQTELEPYIQRADFIVVDNLSTLIRSGKENEAESWLPVQDWAVKLRSQGKAVLFVHHAGKNGEQRGTSRKEDVMDLVIRLKQPEDYQSDQAARFEIEFTKARHLTGRHSKSFEASLTTEGWAFKDIEDARMERVVRLKLEGHSFRDIAQETGISKSSAQRIYEACPPDLFNEISTEVSQRPAPLQETNGTPLN